MTHIAWVPERWVEAARARSSGLGERHPSRAILLFPRPTTRVTRSTRRSTCAASARGRREGRSAPRSSRCASAGRRAPHPASIVQPLLVSDLPGLPPLARRAVRSGRRARAAGRHRRPPRRRLASGAIPERPRRLAGPLRRGRRLGHRLGAARPVARGDRRALAGRRRGETVRVAGPEVEGAPPRPLARLPPARREVELDHEPAGEIELVEVDGRSVERPRHVPRVARATCSPTSSRSSAATASTRRPYGASRRSPT